ncbi:hypothetical protein A0128_12280 [Leptospira tipperaryensis]|uniref:Uncharacterized protein n=1 Tax=Leptospira tipperaryensis TaxID=2564040 RepID=A0A1D7UY98_9LEPT|nr:hypothetical protein A0128_12280 [Leptospira tipperaryensis]
MTYYKKVKRDSETNPFFLRILCLCVFLDSIVVIAHPKLGIENGSSFLESRTFWKRSLERNKNWIFKRDPLLQVVSF